MQNQNYNGLKNNGLDNNILQDDYAIRLIWEFFKIKISRRFCAVASEF